MKLDQGVIDKHDIKKRFFGERAAKASKTLLREIYVKIIGASTIDIQFGLINVNVGPSFTTMEIVDLIREDLDRWPEDRDRRKALYQKTLRAMGDALDAL